MARPYRQPRETRECPVCHAPFQPSPWAVRSGEGKFCSAACRNTQHMKYAQEARIRVCPPATPAEKVRANGLINMRLRRGAITKPAACHDCAATDKKLESHHEDYSKPGEVLWVCRSCHMKRHNKSRRKAS